MKLFESRKFQIWGIVSAMFMLSITLLSPEGLQAIFVLGWTAYFAFTTSILTLHLGGKIAGRHQEKPDVGPEG